ncbi:RrF2 family transcriptional regulator [Ciceribacter selenitireducens]|uniref:RrF2 family transcriptional regulator n=1 Tax=Ciceribacter selenitireducens TaxID=448181 RepID=UPI001AEC2A39
MYCAVNPHVTVRKSDIAAACNASKNHLAQVIRTLGQYGFVDATRGRNGGLQLMRPPAAINIGSVFRIFESDLPFAECFSASNTCPSSKPAGCAMPSATRSTRSIVRRTRSCCPTSSIATTGWRNCFISRCRAVAAAPRRNGRRRRKAKDRRCWTTRQSPEVIRPPHELIDKRQHPSALQHIISCLPE